MFDNSPGTQILNEAQNNPELISNAGFEQFAPGMNARADRIINDSSVDYFHKAQAVLNSRLSDDTKDYLAQYLLNEQSNQNAWDRQMEASNTQYQRAVKDLQAAGLNPFLAIQSLNGSSPTSNGQSVGSGIFSTNARTKMSKDTATIAAIALIAGSLVSVFGKLLK